MISVTAYHVLNMYMPGIFQESLLTHFFFLFLSFSLSSSFKSLPPF